MSNEGTGRRTAASIQMFLVGIIRNRISEIFNASLSAGDTKLSPPQVSSAGAQKNKEQLGVETTATHLSRLSKGPPGVGT